MVKLQVTLNAIALSWVTAGSLPHNTITLDRFSLPTMDVGPLTQVQTEDKEPRSIAQMTLPPDASLPLPESFYDYIPRNQVASLDDSLASKQANRKVCILAIITKSQFNYRIRFSQRWFWNLKTNSRGMRHNSPVSELCLDNRASLKGVSLQTPTVTDCVSSQEGASMSLPL
jgi:hypothetical protein